MEFITEPGRQIPVVHETDILVCGGGFAGVAAAVAAARNGMSVMLVEKYGFSWRACNRCAGHYHSALE
jgi:glycerol-3-phosphate dehydrogenase